eukprot:Opistho-2@3326
MATSAAPPVRPPLSPLKEDEEDSATDTAEDAGALASMAAGDSNNNNNNSGENVAAVTATKEGTAHARIVASQKGRKLDSALESAAFVFVAWVIGYFGLSIAFGAAIALGAFVLARRRRDRLLDDMATEAEKIGREREVEMAEFETTEWLNSLLDRVWYFAEPSLCKQITDALDPVLKENKPGFIDSIQIKQFTLGKRAPHIRSARVLNPLKGETAPISGVDPSWYSSVPPHRVILDVDLVYNAPLSRIILSIVVGRGGISVGLPVEVKEIQFGGKMRIELILGSVMPHVTKAAISFLAPPIFDIGITPLKAVDIMDLPGLSNWIRGLVVGGITGAMLAPKKDHRQHCRPRKGSRR